MFKKIVALCLCIMWVPLTLVGCSKEPVAEPVPQSSAAPEVESTDSDTQLSEVTLEWYLAVPDAGMRDIELIQEEANKLTKEKINANVNIHFMDYANYGQQLQMQIASGATIDLMFTSNWTNDFYSDVAKGAYQPLDFERLKELAPNVIKGVPENAWAAAQVNGELYAIPNTQVLARWPSMLILKKYIDEANFDVSKVKELNDFTSLFQSIRENHPDVFPIDIHKNMDILGYYVSNIGYEYFGSSSPFAVKIGDEALKAINLWDTTEMKDFLYTLRDWYTQGIIRKDAATITDTSGEISNGLYGAMFCVNNPDTKINQARLWGVEPEDIEIIPLSDPFLSTGSIVATMAAVGHNSQNADRVYMLYNMLYDDNDTRLFNLLNFGMEDKHYKKVEEDLIELIPDSGYYVDCGWAYGNIFNSFRTNPDQPKWRPAGPDINNNAIASSILGFSFDPVPVKSELAQISAVMGEMTPALLTGSVEVDSYLLQFNEKLKKAGLATVQEEMQAQIDKWAQNR